MSLEIDAPGALEGELGRLGPLRDRYAECLGSAFRRTADEAGDALVLELVSVSELRTTGWQEGFSLEFRGPAPIPLRQGIHALDHKQLGRLELFLVPIGLDGGSMRYEAIYNRLVGWQASGSEGAR